MKILTVSQMQKAEQDCVKLGISLDSLMENAGKAVAEETRNILGRIEDKKLLVLVGPGNNGGDGLVTARHLHEWGADVTVYLCGRRPESDPKLELVRGRNITCTAAEQDSNLEQLDGALSQADAVIDAIFGTGKSRPLQGIFPQILSRVQQAREKYSRLRVIALDLPSGLNADTGAVDNATPLADNTITLGFPKTGLFNFPGAERAGKITIVDIGIPAKLVDYINTGLIDGDQVKTALPRRYPVANKGTFGKVLVSAGSLNFIGAAYLACTAAIRVGAGLVTLATASSIQPVLASRMIEVTYLPLPESAPGMVSPEAADIVKQAPCDVLLMGPGLGTSEAVTQYVKNMLLSSTTEASAIVLDADALTILARTPDWWQQLTANVILTPHPGEMARLTGKTVSEVQADRLEITRKAAVKWNKTIVLKGAYTVVAEPQGSAWIYPLANAGLATAGTGDVLAGAIAGLNAQGLSLCDAALCGVYLHGQAGEMVKAEMGDAGMIASDLLPVLPLVIRQTKEN